MPYNHSSTMLDGINGGYLLDSGEGEQSVTAGKTWCRIKALQASTFTTLTDASITNMTAANVGTLGAGDWIDGNFTVIHVATGAVIAYER